MILYYHAFLNCHNINNDNWYILYYVLVYFHRRTDEPGPGARICSCHFRDEEKNNGPTILFHRSHQFNPHHLTPVKKKKRNSIRKIITMQAESNISDDHSLDHESISATNTVNNIDDEPLNLSLNLRYINWAFSRTFLN